MESYYNWEKHDHKINSFYYYLLATCELSHWLHHLIIIYIVYLSFQINQVHRLINFLQLITLFYIEKIVITLAKTCIYAIKIQDSEHSGTLYSGYHRDHFLTTKSGCSKRGIIHAIDSIWTLPPGCYREVTGLGRSTVIYTTHSFIKTRQFGSKGMWS